jgi:spermidine synthase
MIPWRLLDQTPVPGRGGELRLYARGEEFSIRVDGQELMNSRAYATEDALSRLGCKRIRERKGARVLIGGLGMGFSLATALDELENDAEVVVAELVASVVEWNRTQLGHLAGHPLRDQRVMVRQADVAQVIAERAAAYDAILLDVDNGPEAMTRPENDWLYGGAGLASARKALRPRGVLGVWSAGPDRSFVRRMHAAGFDVQEVTVTARGHGRGARHVIWLGTPRERG